MKPNEAVIAYCTPVLGEDPHGYLVAYDPEAFDGIGRIELTTDKSKATTYSYRDVLTMLRVIPQCRPLRYDGLPNRPLTAFHIEMMSPDQWPLLHREETKE